MSDFLNTVHKTVINMGKAPYDDKRTQKIVADVTQRTIEHYNKLKGNESPHREETQTNNE